MAYKTIEDCKQEVYGSVIDVLSDLLLRDSEEINGFDFSWTKDDDGEIAGGELDITFPTMNLGDESSCTISWDFVPTEGGYKVMTSNR